MNVTSEAMRQLAERLPLKVLTAEWQDPVLLLQGADWHMSVMTPWRILHQGALLLGSDDAEPNVVADLLTGNLITRCQQQSSAAALDPLLIFSSGHILEIFSVGPLEPWVISLGDANLFVASPSEG